MSDAATQDEPPKRKVRHWLLAILRFAITLEGSDKDAVMAIAREMDGAASKLEAPAFCFFSKMSAEVCGAIVDPNNPQAVGTLDRHLLRIDDPRLRRALRAAIEFERPEPTLHPAKRKNPEDLWKGLRQR